MIVMLNAHSQHRTMRMKKDLSDPIRSMDLFMTHSQWIETGYHEFSRSGLKIERGY